MVGQMKTAHWKEAAAHYMKRLHHWRNIDIAIVKDGGAALPLKMRMAAEAQGILRALKPHEYIICLDERGKSMSSQEFSKFFQDISQRGTPCFVVGGAYGLDESVRTRSQYLLALGSMTLPHELARVVLLEQLYRAEAIVRRIPYHH